MKEEDREWRQIERELTVMTAGGEKGRRLLIKRWLGCIISNEIDLARHLQHDVLSALPEADRKVAEFIIEEVSAAIMLKSE